MLVETIRLDPRIARIHYADYRKRCAKNRALRVRKAAARAVDLERAIGEVRVELERAEKEDEQLLKAYRALYRGQQLIDLPKVMANCGLDSQKLPKLAVCRADATYCYLQIRNDAVFLSPQEIRSWWKLKKGAAMRFGGMAPELRDEHWRRQNNHPMGAKALVPTVPPHLRPDDLSKYYILWEAEWTAKAPVDPLLLSKVNDAFYAVVAQWDLTLMEQRILEGRL
jgi:hypothetical protein